jgi:hypothetical protein
VSSEELPLSSPASDVWSVHDPPGPLVVEVMAADCVVAPTAVQVAPDVGVQPMP